MSYLIDTTLKLIEGFYLCTFGYISGNYNPTLYKQWNKAKHDYNVEAHKSVEFDYLLVQSNI